MSLQEEFIRSQGRPVIRGLVRVVQMDCINIQNAVVKIKFLGGKSNCICGVAIKSTEGFVELSDGSRSSLVHIWDEPEMPDAVEHFVSCPDGKLRVWNIYRTKHVSGKVTEDCWTNNAGMVVERITENYRMYKCSDGIGEFDPGDHIFNILWDECV